MTRQMRKEILSLDLASLTLRLKTLQQSSLGNSGRTLDVMIDMSSVPGKFIDTQDRLEALVKNGLAGLGDFCAILANQWREADKIWWTCTEVVASLKTIERETQEAALKILSDMLATDFEARLQTSTLVLEGLSAKSLRLLPTPVHPVHVPDQPKINGELQSALFEHLQEANSVLEQTQKTVRLYRHAIDSLSAAQAYRKTVTVLSSEIRTAFSKIVKSSPDDICLTETPHDPLDHNRELDKLSSMVLIADTVLLPQAETILMNVQNTGTDPNIRKEIHRCVLALASISREASSLIKQESTKRYVKERAIAFRKEAAEILEKALALQHLAELATRDAVWQEGRSQMQTTTFMNELAILQSSNKRNSDSLYLFKMHHQDSARFPTLYDAVGLVVAQLEKLHDQALQAITNSQTALDLLADVARQTYDVEMVAAEQNTLMANIISLQRDILSR